MPSITRRPSKPREEPGKVERQVLEAVERLLDGGACYTQLGIVQIAEEAGVARSTFYTHYRDKSDLLIRLAEAATDRLFAVAQEWVREGRGGGREELESATLEVVREFRAHASLLRAVAEVAGYEPSVDEFWNGKVNGVAEALEARLREEQAAGEASPDIDPALAAQVLVWAVERNAGRHISIDDGSGDPALATALTQVMWATLYGER